MHIERSILAVYMCTMRVYSLHIVFGLRRTLSTYTIMEKKYLVEPYTVHEKDIIILYIT